MAYRQGRIRPPRRPIAGRAGAGAGGDDDFEACWDLLRQALVDVHRKNAGSLSFEGLYRASYKIVLRRKGDLLYDRVKEFEEKWFRDYVMPPIEESLNKNLLNITLVSMPNSTSVNERRQLGEKFLMGIRDSWVDHNTSMDMIADILMYLDRTYSQESGRPSLFATTIGLFRDNILRNTLEGLGDDTDRPAVIFNVLNAIVLDLINMERDGEVIDRALIRKIVAMLECLYETNEELQDQRLYLTVFEPAYLDNSRSYYRAECEKLLREGDAKEWARYAQRRLDEEESRCNTTVSRSTGPKIAEVVEEEVISAHLDEFLAMEGSGLRSMIDKDRLDDLATVYQLISRVDQSKAPLKKMIQMRVMEMGLEIEQALKKTDFSLPQAAAAEGEDGVGDAPAKAQPLSQGAQQTAAAIRWVDDVLALKDKFDNFLENCFNGDIIIGSAVTKSFSEFINQFSRSSEYVSLFIDDNLKRGIRGKTEAEVDVVLDKAIVLVRYLGDRDLFERYYQKHLGRRLLQGKSESQAAEKEMISRMKQELGSHFTNKFEGMFKDMDLSRDLTNGYREHIRGLGEEEQHRVDLNINVLTTNNWPPDVMGRSAQDNARDCIMPPDIGRLRESFFKYYLKDRSGRVLTWVLSTGSADIKCVFPKVPGKETGPLSKDRRYELNVSTYGMIVLILFNDLAPDQQLTFEEIQERTNIPTQDLSRALASISIAPKSRVLLKDPATKQVRAGDKFGFNAGFVSKTIKIKAPTINATSKVEGDDERRETEKKNDDTRKHIIDAAIVRIMKQRKELSHTNLVSEVITQLAGRFRPEVTMVKARIEDLLSREYLERDEGGSSYRYLA
ncbi:Cullin [Coniochaeta sp. 2T2.1]|nr:Cullin [Coniochaeta sp. 2T2.1]